ncbi:hypothetical protein R0J90_15350, partial [Micrococcus sp. SIMBA_144]
NNAKKVTIKLSIDAHRTPPTQKDGSLEFPKMNDIKRIPISSLKSVLIGIFAFLTVYTCSFQ